MANYAKALYFINYIYMYAPYQRHLKFIACLINPNRNLETLKDKVDQQTNDTHRLVRAREDKINALNEQGINPYPLLWENTTPISDALKQFAEAEKRGEERTAALRCAGRIIASRGMGKLAFIDIFSNGDKIQVQFRRDLINADQFKLLKLLDLGDFIGVGGAVFRTQRGEVTLEALNFTILGKSLLPLPDKFSGLQNVERRRRQRYLDLITDNESFATAHKRAEMVFHIRATMREAGFHEFETPVINPVAAGAGAAPFRTQHSYTSHDLYLRIATELPLKKLIIGGFERVYEIGKVFRNEGIDRDHNPEFTTLEAYQAYASYEDMMTLTEKLVQDVTYAVNGNHILKCYDHTSKEMVEVDISGKWERLSLREQIIRYAKLDFVEYRDIESLSEAMRQRDIHVAPNSSWASLLDKIISAKVEPNLKQPCFLIDYPEETTPFAKLKPGTDRIVERAEAFIGGLEIANMFSELNNPREQRERMEQQERLSKDYGDPDTDRLDEDFLTAMDYGMPPAGGIGIGIDRLAMMIAGVDNIRDIILFPTLYAQEVSPESNATQSFVRAFNKLISKDKKFVEKLREMHPGWWSSNRNFISERKETVYLSSPSLTKSNAKKLKNGLFIDTHLSVEEMKRRVRESCRAVGIKLESIVQRSNILYSEDNNPRWVGYEFQGKPYRYSSATRVFVEVFKRFIECDGFIKNLRKEQPGWWSNNRHFISESKEGVYLSSPSLTKPSAKKLKDGLFIDTHLSVEEMKRRINIARKVARLDDTDLILHVTDRFDSEST